VVSRIHSCRSVRTTGLVDLVSPVGPGGGAAGESNRTVLRHVIVCSVTGSTQAGMIAGFAAQDRPRRVIGVDGSAKPVETHDQVSRIARQTAELIDVGRDLRDDEIILDDRFHAGTYGLAMRDGGAIKLGARWRDDHRPGLRR